MSKQYAPDTAVQTGMLGTTSKLHTQKLAAKPVTASMDAYEKLQEMRAEAKPEPTTRQPAREATISHEDMAHLLAGLELRYEAIAERVDQGNAYLETMKEGMDPRIAKLTALIPRTKEGTSEITHITKGQYRKVWGREPKPNTLTADGKAVRWEYALDEIAQELGLEHKARDSGLQADEYLKNLIEDMHDAKRTIDATSAELASDERTLKAIERLKAGLRKREADVTTGPLVRTIGSIEPTERTKAMRDAKVMGKEAALALVAKVQARRTPAAIAIDQGIRAEVVVPLELAHLWATRPARFDIEGVDTPIPGGTAPAKSKPPRRGKIVKGAGFTDKSKQRLSRQPRKGWRKVKYT